MRATFTPNDPRWGFNQILPLSEATVDAGYLRQDGTLAVRVDLKVSRPSGLLPTPHGVAADLLALLSEPGATSDITLTAGGRSFPAHRAILAARCPFFKALLNGDFADSGAKELPLPDADPDALALLLRYIYGGVLDADCPRALLKPAAELADRLQLDGARSVLENRIEAQASPGSIVGDLLWAAQRGSPGLLERLEGLYLRAATGVSLEDITELAERNPKLMAKLHDALAKGRCVSK